MRSNLLSMCSVVATVAVAGSAVASVTTVDFNSVNTSPSGWVQFSPTTYGGLTWGGDMEVISQAFFNSNYGYDPFVGNIAYNGNDLGASVPVTAASTVGAINLQTIDLGGVWANLAGGLASTQVTIKGFKNNVEVAVLAQNLTSSQQTVTLTGGFSDIDSFSLVSSGGGGYFYFDNLTYSTVPAPGAMALLGVAGLVGARRRR